MARAPPTEEAIRARIISHMNNDHSREITHYLRHYLQLSTRAARGAQLTDVTLDNMTVHTSAGATHIVPIRPPMKSLLDARVRMGEMDTEARSALGIRDVYLTEYKGPAGTDWLVLGGVLFYMACYAAMPWTGPGTAVWDLWDSFFPGGAELQRRIVHAIFVPVVLIHVVECTYLDRSFLVPHGVNRFTGLWFAWIINCFFEGFPSIRRVRGILEAKTQLKLAKGH